MKKKLYVCILLLGFNTSCSYLRPKNSKKQGQIIASYPRKPIDISNPLKCKLEFFQEITGNNNSKQENFNEVIIDLPKKQDSDFVEMVFTFVNNQGNEVIIKPIDLNGDKQETTGYILHEDNQKIVVMEQSLINGLYASYPVFMHTFFKQTGMYIFYKTNTLINTSTLTIPRGTMAVGYCS